MSEPPLIWRFTDGKPGHENQSRALVEEMQNLAAFGCRELPRAEWNWAELASRPARPDLVLGAGHRTHLPLLAAAKRFDCPAVVLMKPSLPLAFFDLCLVPQHDLPGDIPENVLTTRGMLNRLPAAIPPKEESGLILIGGPSKHHDWEATPLRDAIARITTTRRDLDWHLTNSRRTPSGFLDLLDGLSLTLHPCETTGPDWLPTQLIAAREVWVGEDSMSMIYEALTARARVGLLPMPRKSSRSRVIRGVDQLITDRWVTPFAGWEHDLPLPPETIHEASRCAREVVQRFFPTHLA